MHTALAIPKILLIVFEDFRDQEYAQIIRVCRLWYELGVDLLWSQNRIHLEEPINTIPAIRRAWFFVLGGSKLCRLSKIRLGGDRRPTR